MDQWLTVQDIERKIIALISSARKRYAIPDDCTGEEACARVGLTIRRGMLPAGSDGMLVDDRVIVVNQTLIWQPRIDFTLFHEIVHYLLNEDGELIEFFTATLHNDDAKYRLAIERCCHQGAAEFVLPQSRVRDTIAVEGFAAHLVERIATRSATSLITAAIQLAICAPVNCYVVLCGFGPIPRSRPPMSGLHIEYAPAPWRGKYPLARFTRVPDDHLLAQVWREHEPAAGVSYVPFRSGKRMPCHCDATYVAGRVIGILALERPVPSQQLVLFQPV